MGGDKMARLHRKPRPASKFIVNDHGNLVTIKQPLIMELNTIYQAIIANKKVVNTVFQYLELENV